MTYAQAPAHLLTGMMLVLFGAYWLISPQVS